MTADGRARGANSQRWPTNIELNGLVNKAIEAIERLLKSGETKCNVNVHCIAITR